MVKKRTATLNSLANLLKSSRVSSSPVPLTSGSMTLHASSINSAGSVVTAYLRLFLHLLGLFLESSMPMSCHWREIMLRS